MTSNVNLGGTAEQGVNPHDVSPPQSRQTNRGGNGAITQGCPLAGCHCLAAGGQAVLWLRCTSDDHEHGGVAPVAGAGAADGSGLGGPARF